MLMLQELHQSNMGKFSRHVKGYFRNLLTDLDNDATAMKHFLRLILRDVAVLLKPFKQVIKLATLIPYQQILSIQK